MSMLRPIAWLAAVLTALPTAALAANPKLPDQQLTPFVDPSYFNPDFQFFAPAEVDDFGGEEKANTGIYVSFDRTYVNVTRPIDQFSFGSGNQGDFTWGNRLELGYMLGDPSGWQAILWHVNGPNETFANSDYQQRIENLTGQVTQQFLIPGGVDSINQLKMSSFEFNKVWRLKQYHSGAVLEPFLGYRYMNVRDYFRRDQFAEFAFANGDEGLLHNTHFAQFENQMHGGTLGGRLFRQRGHWLLSCDVRFFAMANFQTLKVTNLQSALPNPDNQFVDGVFDDLIVPFGGDVNREVNYQRATQFCFGGEIRGEASYELTRDVNLRVGFVFLDLGQGIGRGDLLRLNNQAVQMAGVTFGFTVNR